MIGSCKKCLLNLSYPFVDYSIKLCNFVSIKKQKVQCALDDYLFFYRFENVGCTDVRKLDVKLGHKLGVFHAPSILHSNNSFSHVPSDSSDHGTASLTLDIASSPLQKSPTRSPSSPDGAAPPSLASAVLTMPRCNVNLVKLSEPRSHIKLLDSIPSIPISVPPVTSPITVLPGSNKAVPEDDEKSTGMVCTIVPL